MGLLRKLLDPVDTEKKSRIGNLCMLPNRRLKCRSSQSHQPAGVPLAHLILHLDVAHDCPKSRRRYQFFESTSFNARLSSVSSATTCFSFRFSSSTCFSRFASPLSIPPYFAFQR